MADNAVTVVVVNWNGREFLSACLESVLAQECPGGVRVVVVDNGSTDGSQDYLATQFPQVELVANDPNNYAAANNRGVSMAEGPFAMLLNTDTELAPGCIAGLVSALDADQKASAAAQ